MAACVFPLRTRRCWSVNWEIGPGGGLVSLIVNSDGSFDMVVLELPADQDIPHDLLFVIALAMELDHQGILLCNQKL